MITPRFLTEGDAVRLPTVVHNYLPERAAIDVSIAAKGLDAGRDATLAAPSAADRVEGRSAARMAVRGEDRRHRDRHRHRHDHRMTATRWSCRCRCCPTARWRRPATRDRSAGQPSRPLELTIPEQSNPAARTIEVALAPSLAGSLFGALDFLTDYPYGCTEQTLSSFFPNLAVLRALDELKLAPTERLRLVDRMAADGVKRLSICSTTMAGGDGGRRTRTIRS